MTDATILEKTLRRDRLIVMTGLATVVALAAVYTVAGVGMSMSALSMTQMALNLPGMMMEPAVWSPYYAGLIFLMWWVMMIAMMVPSATPMILLYTAVVRKRTSLDAPFVAVACFLAGYLAVWGAFSLLAMALQWGLEALGTVTGMMEIANAPIAGGVLILAGLYQLTPLKKACLKHCQHPLIFLLHHWKPGGAGAFRMGAEHGIYCLGCCWILMALLFVGGIMNLLWIAGIAIYVGVEKLAAGHRWVTVVTGIVLTLGGVMLAARPLLAA